MSPEQNRVQQRLPRFGSHLHSAEYVQKVYDAISRVSRCIERRIHPYKRESVGRMSCGLRIAVLDVTICNTYEIHCSQRPREV